MAKITCPKCGEVIDVDPSQVEDLTRQLRDELFERDLETRLAEAGHLHEAQLLAMREQERRDADRRVAQADAQKRELEEQLKAASRDAELALQQERAKAADQRAAWEREESERRAREQKAAQEASLQARERETKLSQEVASLQARLEAQEATLRAESQAELLRATGQLEQSRNELEAKLQVAQANSEQAQAALREEMARREAELIQRNEEQLKDKDARIQQYAEEVDRLKEYRMRLSTKLVGESLERHCESEFNRIRMQAYPRALFEKDNEAVGGTKGDFIFRDYDEEGNELLSIMFEMKNEEETSSTTNRKRNEDHFKKLDGDRTKKNCEYAVLVSTLEPDNDFYNAGIADVSWRYPKMFVVRPQCFTTIIGLLKAAALAAHPYKMQLERARKEELDVSLFEQKVTGLVDGITHDYELASKNYEQAANDIDAIIKKLEHLKGQLGTAAKHLGTASKRGEKLTIKRLTRGNPTMKEAFAQVAASEQSAAQAPQISADDDDVLDAPLDPDELE